MCSVGWSCGVGRRSLVLRAFRPAAGSVADLCRGVEPAAGRCRSVDHCLFTLATPACRLPFSSRDGKWLVWGRAGGGIPCVCHLSVGCWVPDSCWPPTPPAPQHRPPPQHREMANGWYGVELGAAYRAFAISRWGAGSGLLLATDIAPTPRHRTRHSAPPPLGTAPRPRHRPPPQHREMANGCYGVELGAAYRAFAISRWVPGYGLLPPLGTGPGPRHRARPSTPPPLGTAPGSQYREMANGWNGVELGPAYRAFAISRRGNPAGPG